MDHTADIQLHAWGDDLTEAYEQCAMAMFGYMTEIEYVEMVDTQTIEAEGDDLIGLLYHFLDEWLFLFSAEPFFIPRVSSSAHLSIVVTINLKFVSFIQKVKITEFDKVNFKIKAEGYGETFEIGKHPQGTEVKAITYSNMQVHDNPDKHEVFVILDI